MACATAACDPMLSFANARFAPSTVGATGRRRRLRSPVHFSGQHLGLRPLHGQHRGRHACASPSLKRALRSQAPPPSCACLARACTNTLLQAEQVVRACGRRTRLRDGEAQATRCGVGRAALLSRPCSPAEWGGERMPAPPALAPTAERARGTQPNVRNGPKAVAHSTLPSAPTNRDASQLPHATQT